MASLLAEITDKRKLVQGMMPIVSNIFILGLLLKLLIITMVLITVNSAGKMIYGFGQAAI
ncbi:hypothetical protein IscW_ISCW006832 [Ixodes scapularis]|uniref:Uncharacterized protein n=1 Tax=Ixodes scapularis TaxID=6945 RepID=B7PKV9_IXOSC|nr:hypothetical protein IscW_ISCW006832 [Ixodes scapularis]|eukprot:XP_002434407.1 hypothetical protein IscW_ISCW006832 [Ixodes scapularis]